MATAPTLQTDRLTLTGHHPDDLDDLVAMWAEPDVYRMIGGVARAREEVWIRLLRSIGQWTAFGYGAWVARETATGAFVGEIGLIEARRAIVPPIDADPEVGWTLAPRAHGRGFASEALAAAFAWTDARAIARTVCIIDPGNAASIRLAGRMGYRRERDAVYKGEPILVFARAAAIPGKAQSTAGACHDAGPAAADPLQDRG